MTLVRMTLVRMTLVRDSYLAPPLSRNPFQPRAGKDSRESQWCEKGFSHQQVWFTILTHVPTVIGRKGRTTRAARWRDGSVLRVLL